MDHPERDADETWRWGEALLLGLVAAGLTVVVAYPTLGHPYDAAQVRLVLDTVITLAAVIVAVLAAIRVSVEGRWSDVLLCTGFAVTAAATFAFSVVPLLDGSLTIAASDGWAGIVGRIIGAAFIAVAPFIGRRTSRSRRALTLGLTAGGAALLGAWWLLERASSHLPSLTTPDGGHQPTQLTAALAVPALLALVALLGFWRRYRDEGEDLDRWLALGATLTMFADVHAVLTPLPQLTYVSQGDFMRAVAYGVLLAGVWRAIRSAEHGRAVAEERARVAREIHDGLQQYLFSIATHVSMLRPDRVTEKTIDQLRKAATAAQQEARFAVLALSSASGHAPLDAALRRYVDVLTADGQLAVDLDIDREVRLAPDEQIEVFRIVQEGLANVRRHAGARHADVLITKRSGRRVLVVVDDGTGFESGTAEESAGAGQGLQNIRRRATSIGAAFALHSSPGKGTALEVVLRA
ncbi:MAG TPA: histidine kinase [Gaiellaceae bacterium]|nr:histidine kinase [Gaiellaceae bacterium]